MAINESKNNKILNFFCPVDGDNRRYELATFLAIATVFMIAGLGLQLSGYTNWVGYIAQPLRNIQVNEALAIGAGLGFALAVIGTAIPVSDGKVKVNTI